MNDRDTIAGGDLALLVGRLLMAYIFIRSGYGKLMGLEQFAGGLTRMGAPAEYSYWLAVVAACVEFFGAICIVLGLATRYVALLLAVFALIATLLAHRYWTYDAAQVQAQMTNFNKNLVIIGGFLILYVAGAGRWSIDRRGT
jgi:putative oxidoreductase